MEPNIPQDLINALQRYEDLAQSVLESFIRPRDARSAPPKIYHYTNGAGLRGILETGRIWLSDIFSLNDPSELKHGVSHAIEILNEKARGGPPEATTFARHFSEFHDQALEGSAHYFVCAFSSDADDLGQWRAYGDNGRGYTLEFDGVELENAFTKLNGAPIANNSTLYVTYDDGALLDIDRRLIEGMFSLISAPRGRGMDLPSINSFMKDLSISTSLQVLRASLFFKHEAYQNEKEFRFLQIYPSHLPAPDVLRRFRPYELIQYREFDWRSICPGALKRIIVGPAADPEKAPRFAAACLRAYSPTRVDVFQSKIPYRAT